MSHYYAVALAAFHMTENGSAVGLRTALVRADSEAEAEAAALEVAFIAYPITDGWIDHYGTAPYRIDKAIIEIERPLIMDPRRRWRLPRWVKVGRQVRDESGAWAITAIHRSAGGDGLSKVEVEGNGTRSIWLFEFLLNFSPEDKAA